MAFDPARSVTAPRRPVPRRETGRPRRHGLARSPVLYAGRRRSYRDRRCTGII